MKKLNFLFVAMILILATQVAASPMKSGRHNNGNWEFTTETVTDNAQTDEDAFTIDVPEGWDFEAEINWYLDDLPFYTVTIIITSPDKTMRLAVLPSAGYVWFSDRTLQMYMPEGAAYAANTTVLQPRDAEAYLEELLIPYLEDVYRDEARIRDFEVVNIRNRRDYLENFGDLMDNDLFTEYYDLDAAEAEIEYSENGVDIEETIGTIIGTHEDLIMGISSYNLEEVTYWVMLVSIVEKAPLGELADMKGVYEDILRSIEWKADFIDAFQELHDEYYRNLQRRRDDQFQRWSDNFNNDD